MAKKLSHEEFKNRMNLISPTIEILGQYVNAKTKIKCRCLLDGYEWYATPDNLLRGCGCPKCAGKVRTTDMFKTN